MSGFKKFDRGDWDGMAGAEPFADGTDPLVNYDIKVDGLDAMAVLDGNGFALEVYTADGEMIGATYVSELDPLHIVAWIGVMRFLAAAKDDWTTWELMDLGLAFEPLSASVEP